MSANLPRSELGEEDNLLVEAVSLLVQRQHETEKWVAEKVSQADERTAATERRYAELEARLADLEEQLARVAREVEPSHGDAAPDERLARLRAQLEALKSGGNGVPAAIASPRGASHAPEAAPARDPEAARASAPDARPAAPRDDRPTNESAPEYQPRIPIPPEWRSRYAARPMKAPTPSRGEPMPPRQGVTFLDVLGSSPQDRFGLVFIGVGAVAVLYALLSLLRGG